MILPVPCRAHRSGLPALQRLPAIILAGPRQEYWWFQRDVSQLHYHLHSRNSRLLGRVCCCRLDAGLTESLVSWRKETDYVCVNVAHRHIPVPFHHQQDRGCRPRLFLCIGSYTVRSLPAIRVTYYADARFVPQKRGMFLQWMLSSILGDLL